MASQRKRGPVAFRPRLSAGLAFQIVICYLLLIYTPPAYGSDEDLPKEQRKLRGVQFCIWRPLWAVVFNELNCNFIPVTMYQDSQTPRGELENYIPSGVLNCE
jgi:hypothetical protein